MHTAFVIISMISPQDFRRGSAVNGERNSCVGTGGKISSTLSSIMGTRMNPIHSFGACPYWLLQVREWAMRLAYLNFYAFGFEKVQI